MYSYLLLSAVQSTEDRLTLHDIVASMPTDPLSLFVIGLMIVAVVLVLWFGRSGPGKGDSVS